MPSSPSSFDSIKTKWYPEIRHHCPTTPFILVGTKSDLRGSPDVLARLAREGKAPVSTAEGQKMAGALKAAAYLECSALTQQGLKAVFDTAIQTALNAKDPAAEGKAPKKKCAIV